MIVSWNWLTDYVRLDLPVAALAERLALSGLNHESTEDVGGDLAIDLEVTSNRPDCLSHIGVAREIAVLLGRSLRVPDPRPETSGEAAESLAGVRVDAPDLCPRFTARVITGVTIGPSPWWLRKRLETLGQRPVNNVVDATNYVMFECGQPLHAYDLDRLHGRSIVVRRGLAGEKLAAINNKEYAITPEMLVIADADRPIGLAGVMGGLDTEIGPASRNVLLESAQFDAMATRKASRSLNLPSEASRRFERPLDPAMTEWASRRCAALLAEIAGGTVHPGLIDVGRPSAERPPVTLRLAQIRRILGIDVPEEAVDRILPALGLELVESAPGRRSYVAPTWRADLTREVDLIEEVGRIHGYDHVPEDRAVPLVATTRGARERVEDAVRGVLTGLGFDESVTYSLVAEPLAAPIGEDGDAGAAPPLRVEHSSRRRENCLRRSLVPSLLALRGSNEAHGQADAELFEVAHVYLPRPGRPLPDEPTRLAIVSGRDFAGLKGVVEAILDRLHIGGEVRYAPASGPPFVAGHAAEVTLDGEPLGRLGLIDRAAPGQSGLRGACSAAELSFDLIQSRAVLVPGHRPQPSTPAVARDLSLVVPRSLAWAELDRVAREFAGPELESVQYLDTFRGGNLADDLQSVHFGLRFRHPERTLTGDEVETAVRAVVAACVSRFGATLRT